MVKTKGVKLSRWRATKLMKELNLIDLFSRKPVGWAMSFFPDSALTAKALSMAWEARGKPANLLYHSDQGFVDHCRVAAFSKLTYDLLLG